MLLLAISGYDYPDLLLTFLTTITVKTFYDCWLAITIGFGHGFSKNIYIWYVYLLQIQGPIFRHFLSEAAKLSAHSTCDNCAFPLQLLEFR